MGYVYFEHHLIWRIFHKKLKFKNNFDIEMGKILLIDELQMFYRKSKQIENKISNKTPLHDDINVLEDYFNDIKRLLKILRAKKKSIKKEIKEFKIMSHLMNNATH